ncbi:MAG: hypothetical protein COA79_25330 [Planctomycetota bacterium]|nr:MAG: hypothetical protein COA79_25330 [Planctomycetota bacterium]
MVLKPYVRGLVLLAILLSLASVGFAQDAHGAATVAVAVPFNKSFAVGLACFGVAIGVGLVGFASASAVGRNPGAAGEVLKIGIIGMALVEAIAFYVIFFPY